MKTSLEKGADVNAVDEEGKTALMIAAENGHAGAVQTLLEKRAHLHLKDKRGKTALMFAVEKGNTEIITMFKDKIESYNSELLIAAEKGEFYKVLSLLRPGIDINVRDEEGKTPLHKAAEGGHYDVADLLIEKRADVNAKDAGGATPLSSAVTYENKKIVELLIIRQTDLNVKDKNGNTALMIAEEKGNTEIITMFKDPESLKHKITKFVVKPSLSEFIFDLECKKSTGRVSGYVLHIKRDTELIHSEELDISAYWEPGELEDCFDDFGSTLVDIRDFNFDGYPDFKYPISQGSGGVFYSWGEYDIEKGNFEGSQLSGLWSPEFDFENKIITSHSIAGMAGRSYSRVSHKFIDSKLTPIREEVQNPILDIDDFYLRTVRVRGEDGEMNLSCEISISHIGDGKVSPQKRVVKRDQGAEGIITFSKDLATMS